MKMKNSIAGESAAAAVVPNPDGRLEAGLSRQRALKFLGAAAKPLDSRPNDLNPRWYGFNLLEYFSTDPDWMKYFPYKNDEQFLEDDFRWMRDWGFNFARLPMDYRFWTDVNNPLKINERKVEPIDRAIRGMRNIEFTSISACTGRRDSASSIPNGSERNLRIGMVINSTGLF
jgi:hypothetical protein